MASKIQSILLAIVAVAALHSCPVHGEEGPRARMDSITDYAVYYGLGRVDDLKRFDLAVTQPNTLDATQIATLATNGTLAVAYLSIGEVEPTREWFLDGRVDPSWILGTNANWGSLFVNAAEPGWQQLMYDLAGEFIAKGFDGVFLDTLDTVDLFPQMRDGMIALVSGLRQQYPEAILVQNRGFSVIEALTNTVDAVMFESLTTTYNFETGEYLYASNSVTAAWLAGLSAGSGIKVLSLDYADNPAMAYLAVQASHAYGFVPAVSTIMLNDIPDYGLDAGGPADMRVRRIAVEVSKTGTGSITVTIENIGLALSTNALASIYIGGQLLASTNIVETGIGDRVVWHVQWNEVPASAIIKAEVTDPADTKLPNNSLEIEFKSKRRRWALMVLSSLGNAFSSGIKKTV